MKHSNLNSWVAVPGNEGSSIISSEEAVLRTLSYFDIFHYPLTKAEIVAFSNIPLSAEILESSLNGLVSRQIVYPYNEFYSLHNNPLLVHRRIQGNERATHLLQKAQRIGRFLYQFPFVKAIGVSGSLSKNFADQKADIDFFIITSTNRLWVARTIMHLYKKLTFLTGRQHYYCMNYYINEKEYELKERNIFTAIEIKTLVPVCGEKEIQAFFAANKWADEWLPVCGYKLQQLKEPNRSWMKKLGEWLLGGNRGGRLDDYLLNTTTRRWKKKETRGMKNNKGVRMGLLTNKDFAKSNPGDFQQKVLSMYQQRVEGLMEKHNTASYINFSAK
ncbi:MAG: hypothetical protein JNM19_09695 [Chitinophagaceae bacterium]|nr:hypothetical protein [Chitinophagaceae bacterium]